MIAWNRYHDVLTRHDGLGLHGRVHRILGLAIEASGPSIPVGGLCRIDTAEGGREAIVAACGQGGCVLQALDGIDGVRAGDLVTAVGPGLSVPVGPGLIGRTMDARGRPIDGKGPIPGHGRRPLEADPPAAYGRPPIDTILETGLRVVDCLFTMGRGQRMGVFAGSGVGKSTLLGEMAKHARADVNVIALVGERGREVAEFIDTILGPEGMARTVVIVATSDRPAVERLSAAYAAHAVAEHFRDAGLDVLLMMDSLTRFCQASRDMGLAAGEPPTMRGYPPSTFARLPRLLERAGTSHHGSITAIYTVLIEGDDENDPVADNARAILDGHLFLSRQLAGRSIYPSVDPLLSISRLQVALVSADEQGLVQRARELWSEYERVRDLVEVGAYASGADPTVDQAVACHPRLVEFIRQGLDQPVARADAMQQLAAIVAPEAA